MKFLKIVFLTITFTVLFSSMTVADDFELIADQSFFQFDDSQVEVEGSTVQISHASLFSHILQQPRWINFLIIDCFFASVKADINFYSEPLKYYWFEATTFSSYRVSLWKESNSQYRQLALAD